MSYKLPTPHDTFWGNVMEIKSIAESFFRAHLPQVSKVEKAS